MLNLYLKKLNRPLHKYSQGTQSISDLCIALCIFFQRALHYYLSVFPDASGSYLLIALRLTFYPSHIERSGAPMLRGNIDEILQRPLDSFCNSNKFQYRHKFANGDTNKVYLDIY